MAKKAQSTSERLLAAMQAVKADVHATMMGDEDSLCHVRGWISTGCPVLDIIMGGGLPYGRIVEIFGKTSSGKSLVASQIIASIQDDDGVGVYLDSESAGSLPIMKAVGVDVDNLLYAAPDTVEGVFAIMESVIASVDDETKMVIVWDSVAATSSMDEMGKETGNTGYLTHARVISQGLRKNARAIAQKQISLVLINQQKTKLGVMFGDNVATFGGDSVGFYSSIRVQLTQGSKIKEGDRVVGIAARATVKKNKVATPFRTAKLPIYFGHGIDEVEAAFLALKDAKIIKYTGGWYRYTDPQGVEHKIRKADFETLYDSLYDVLYDEIEAWYAGTDLI